MVIEKFTHIFMYRLESKINYLSNRKPNYFSRIWVQFNHRYTYIFLIIITISSLTYLYINNVLKYQYNQNKIIERIVKIQTTTQYKSFHFVADTHELHNDNVYALKTNSFNYQPILKKVRNKNKKNKNKNKNNSFIIKSIVSSNHPSPKLIKSRPNPLLLRDDELMIFNSINLSQLESSYKAALK